MHLEIHLRKPRVLTPLRFFNTYVRNEVELVPLACEDARNLVNWKICAGVLDLLRIRTIKSVEGGTEKSTHFWFTGPSL